MLLNAFILFRLFGAIISDTNTVTPDGNSLQNAINNIPQYTPKSDVSEDISMFQSLSVALQDILDGESNGFSQDFDGGNGQGIMTNNENTANDISYLPPLSQISPSEEKEIPRQSTGQNIITNNLKIIDWGKLGHDLQKSSHSVDKPVRNIFHNNEPESFQESNIQRKKSFGSTFDGMNQNDDLRIKKESISDQSIHKVHHAGNDASKNSYSNQIGKSLIALPGDIVWRFDQPKLSSDTCCKDTEKNDNELSSHESSSEMESTISSSSSSSSSSEDDSEEGSNEDESTFKALSIAIDSVYHKLLPTKYPCCQELYPVYKPTITQLVSEIKGHPKSSPENRECRELFAMLWRDLKECVKINMPTTRQFINQLHSFDEIEKEYSKHQSNKMMISRARKAKRIYLRNALRSRARMFGITKRLDNSNGRLWWQYGGKLIQYPRWRYRGQLTKYPMWWYRANVFNSPRRWYGGNIYNSPRRWYKGNVYNRPGWWYGGTVFNRPRRWYGGIRNQYPGYLGYRNKFDPRGYYTGKRQPPWISEKAPFSSSEVGLECVH